MDVGKAKFEHKVGAGLGSVFEAVKKQLQESEACRHLVAAGKETLLAVRAVLDSKIRLLEELSKPPEEESGEATSEPRRIEVE